MAGALGRRKIVQIAVSADDVMLPDAEGSTRCNTIYALADDGTLWMRLGIQGGVWMQVAPLPHREQPPAGPRPTGGF